MIKSMPGRILHSCRAYCNYGLTVPADAGAIALAD